MIDIEVEDNKKNQLKILKNDFWILEGLVW